MRPGTPSLHHLLYVGRIAHLSVEGSRFHGGYQGHLLKSRARRSEIRYNLLVDGPDGHASYELEFPEGGVAVVVGNVIGQGADSANPTVLAYGAEGSRWPENRLLLAHNTLISEGWRPALFARVWGDRLPADTRFVVARNNLTVGWGCSPWPAGLAPGQSCAAPRCARSGAGGFTLADRFAAARPGGAPRRRRTLRPVAEFRFPVGTVPLVVPTRWVPGAFQRAATVLPGRPAAPGACGMARGLARGAYWRRLALRGGAHSAGLGSAFSPSGMTVTRTSGTWARPPRITPRRGDTSWKSRPQPRVT
jgi:hypothetical protein